MYNTFAAQVFANVVFGINPFATTINRNAHDLIIFPWFIVYRNQLNFIYLLINKFCEIHWKQFFKKDYCIILKECLFRMCKQNVFYLKKLILIWKGWNTAPPLRRIRVFRLRTRFLVMFGCNHYRVYYIVSFLRLYFDGGVPGEYMIYF